MKIDFKYISLKWFPINKIGWWLFYYKSYTFVKGFNLRVFGCHFNVRENNATEKLIAYGKQ